MATVQVLCPNGRRQTVKVTPNTKLLQVLEEVCTKQNFHPVDDFSLIHGRTTADLTLAFRFSNLPNNARLELVKVPQPRSLTEGEVTIALQLEEGKRLQHSFSSSTSLWEILGYWDLQSGGKEPGTLTGVADSQILPVHPVCIYMREEVTGEHALKNTTLKKLGLMSGKAVIRLLHRTVDKSVMEAIIDVIEQEKNRQMKLAAKLQDDSTELMSSHADALHVSQSTSSYKPNKKITSLEGTDAPERLVDHVLTEQTKCHEREGMGASSDVDAAAYQEETESNALLKQNMNALGDEVYTSADLSKFSHQDLQACEREETVYDSNEQSNSPIMMEDMGEDFFEVTETDVRSMMKDLQRQASFERPLMTEAMRIAKLEEQHEQYNFVVIRVQFPDGLVLQGCFRPRETVLTLYTFVREHLDDKEQDFYLCTSPPRKILVDKAQTLVQANLAPASVVYFGSEQFRDHSLAKSCIMTIASKKLADEISINRLSRKKIKVTPENAASGKVSPPRQKDGGGAGMTERGSGAQSSGSAGRAVSAPDKDSKMPKWLKMGKK